jgi:citrate lyase beta subunit
VAVVNRAFVPDAIAIQWAEQVVKAVRDSAAGVVSVDGRMIDKPLIARAERVLAMAAIFGSQ